MIIGARHARPQADGRGAGAVGVAGFEFRVPTAEVFVVSLVASFVDFFPISEKTEYRILKSQ